MNGRTALAAAALLAVASPSRRDGRADPPAQRSETLIRVLLSARPPAARVSSPSGFNLLSAGGSADGGGARRSGAAWRIEREGRRVRAVRPDGVPTVWAEGSIRVQPVESALLSSTDRRIGASSRSPARTAGSP